MLPNLSELKKACDKLGLNVVQSGKREAKSDYVKVLREFYLKRDYPMGLPYEEVDPMLCFASWNLEPAEFEGLWRNPTWVAQSKQNGCRVILHFTGSGVFAHSRSVSVKTYRMQELTGKLLFADFTGLAGWTLDCEAIIEKTVDTRPYTAKGEVTKSSLHSTVSALHLEDNASKRMQREQAAPLMFKVIDVIKAGHRDFRREPLEVRLDKISRLFSEYFSQNPDIGQYFVELPVCREDKKAFCEKIWAEGGEGVILKNLRSTYEDSSSRRRDAWVKVKKRLEVDAFVTGFKRGEPGTGFANLVGALEFSVNVEGGKTHAIGFPINMTMEERQRITVYDPATDTVSMIPSMYGRVAEISGQDISARELRLSHCTWDRWREGVDAKLPEQCVMSLVDLRRMAEWVG